MGECDVVGARCCDRRSSKPRGIPTAPCWSPTGEWVAFVSGSSIFVVHPDGTGLRQASAAGESYEPSVSWSPDGKWLVTTHYGPYVEVIEVATGLRLPMMFTGNLTDPAWRPN